MSSKLHFTIFTKTTELPSNWDEVAHDNAFLQTPYLSVLEQSAPTNMECFFIGIFEGEELIGVSLAQYLNVDKLISFGERLHCMKTRVRNFAFRQFASHVLIIGNNMITGQNGYAFSKSINFNDISILLRAMADEIIQYFKKKCIRIHLVSFKDFYEECATELKQHQFKSLFGFTVQPNMIFLLRSEWKSMADYVESLSKKYRDQYKRSHKKYEGIECLELTWEQIQQNESRLYELYYHVALNASFNTFFLAPNHFSTFKKQCGDRFKLFGYYFEGKLVGFHTLLLNGKTLETYFLGYDASLQKEKMLYLNMLYNMTEFGITHQFERIIYGRTAMEIKSSIGASPIPMHGFMYHTQPLINRCVPQLFKNLEPPVAWEQRHPFKEV
ncbi:GNAT family N-acetyltransferase [Flavobacterium sp. N1719]|uniref:GNAT family N-acetyltransferase n=1 Tax=Flavobacterium sp. N1719 TaxID=2885633 RepID=UPI0022222511|nr:GNAT family N-acetyltransferase [Flavobacterium sp. N1719]